MTEQDVTEPQYGDPLSYPFWEAAARRELVVQQCGGCGTHQFYPRPFCLSCYSDDLAWVQVSGQATVYSQTTVLITGDPYTVAVVELAEGPRMMTHIEGEPVSIGDTVRVSWRERDGMPPLPIFSLAS